MSRDRSGPPELRRLQDWMQAVITHPGGVVAGAAEARELAPGVDARAVVSTPELSGAERLAIYSRSYHNRLLQCMQALHPALHHALGDELFDHFALGYLWQHPPRSYTLDRLAADFPSYLAATRPDSNAPPEERESWPDFIIELASLEGAIAEVFDGPGLEGGERPMGRDVGMLSLDQLAACRPSPSPSLRLFAFHYPVDRYLTAFRQGEKPELPGAAERRVAVARRNYRVVMHELTEPHFRLLGLLDGRRTVAEALAQSQAGEGSELSLAGVVGALAGWATRGFFASLGA